MNGQRLETVDGVHHLLGQFHSTLASLQESLVHGKHHSQILTVLTDHVDLLLAVSIMTVECHHHRLSEALHVVDMSVQVLQTLLQTLHIRFLDGLQWHATVHLQSLGRGDDNHQTRLQTRLTALDVEEFLCSEVCSKSGLRHHIVAKGHGHLRSHHTRTAVGDVCERTAMDEGRCMLRRLHKVGVQGIAQQHCDGSCHAEVTHTEGLSLGSDAQHDILYATLQVLLTRSQTEYGHELRCRGDVEACLVHHTVTPQTCHHVAQGPVVHVEHPLPEDLPQREAFLTVLVDIVVEQRTDGVVGRGHGVEVAREVQVDLLHRQHLGIAATSSTTLDAKARSQRWFAQSHHGLLADLVQTQCQTDTHRSLTDTRLCRADGRHQNQPALLHFLLINHLHWHLRHEAAVGVYSLRVNTHLGSDLTDWFQFAFPCNLYICLHIGCKVTK